MPTAWSAASRTIGTISVIGAPNEYSRPGNPGTFVMVTLNSRVAYSSRARLTCNAGGASSVKPTSTLLASASSFPLVLLGGGAYELVGAPRIGFRHRQLDEHR